MPASTEKGRIYGPFFVEYNRLDGNAFKLEWQFPSTLWRSLNFLDALVHPGD